MEPTMNLNPGMAGFAGNTSLDQLLEQQRQITALIEQQKALSRNADLQKVVNLITSYGFTPAEIALGCGWDAKQLKAMVPKKPATPLYQFERIGKDGKKFMKTWTGKGIKHKEVEAWLKGNGHKLEDLLIVKPAPAAETPAAAPAASKVPSL